MKLELRKIAIKDVCFDKECKIVDGCLHIDPAKLEDLVLEDSRDCSGKICRKPEKA